jgi:hypothetical protein
MESRQRPPPPLFTENFRHEFHAKRLRPHLKCRNEKRSDRKKCRNEENVGMRKV